MKRNPLGSGYTPGTEKKVWSMFISHRISVLGSWSSVSMLQSENTTHIHASLLPSSTKGPSSQLMFFYNGQNWLAPHVLQIECYHHSISIIYTYLSTSPCRPGVAWTGLQSITGKPTMHTRSYLRATQRDQFT
ncbi:hypothetical protein AMECASPLE_015752 [Ameca splendens]|uniref:Uncharacterized protein n=1 Tax=Ameca splendens TaxID=208324 RepID=A0ABV0YD79_9TELE